MTFAVWARGLSGPYHFDDFTTPLADPASASLPAFGREVAATLRPVTKLTYAIEASLGLEPHPAVRRAVTAVAHAAAAAILFAILGALAPRLGLAGAALLALAWGVHPVHAESVLQLAGRPAALSGALLLGALLAQLRDRRWLAALLLLAAALARETALLGLLPIAVVELARRRPLARLAPAAIAAALATVWILATPRVQTLASFSLEGRPFADVVPQIAAVPVGLSLYFRPQALSMDHGEWLPSSPLAPLFLLGIAIYLAAAVTVVLATRRAPALAAGAALWLAAILPTQSLIPKLDALTERPLALALAGLVLAAGWAAAHAPRAAIAVVAPAIVALVVATTSRGRLYASELALWGDAAAKSTHNPRPHVNHALLLRDRGERHAARRALERAREIDPANPRAERLLAAMSREETP